MAKCKQYPRRELAHGFLYEPWQLQVIRGHAEVEDLADDKLATSGSGRTGINPHQRRFRHLRDLPLFENILCINGLGDILAVESDYEEGCKRGAIEIKSEEGVCFIEYPPRI